MPAGSTSSARVDVTIVGVNDAPVVPPAGISLAENAPATNITSQLLANATGPDPSPTGILLHTDPAPPQPSGFYRIRHR